MFIVIKNLRRLFTGQRLFALLIMLTQALGVFALCFCVSVLYNNHYELLESDNKARSIGINLLQPLKVNGGDDNDSLVKGIREIFGENVNEVLLMSFEAEEAYEGGVVGYVATGRPGEGGLTYSEESMDNLRVQTNSGRSLSEDDFLQRKRVCVVTTGYDRSSASIEGTQLEIVGRRDMELAIVWLPATTWNFVTHSVELTFYRIPTQVDYDRYCRLMDGLVGPDGYEISPYFAGNDDMKALYRTVAFAVVGVSVLVLGTLMVLYGYIYETRRDVLVKMKLCGCSKAYAARCYITESLLISTAAALMGLGIFALCEKLWLVKYYPYTVSLSGTGAYAGCMAVVFTLVMVENMIMSFANASVSLKEQLRSL
ncbi:MAG: hypothetical protein IKN24_01410 [Lachnospiraceae bacterium]|nr:hypothetical protein [Lachnospiraceae bacterium]